MGKEILGLMQCPECGFMEAQVKEQKNGLAYRFCPDCSAQYFTRRPVDSDRLILKIRPASPVTGTGAQKKIEPAAAEAPRAKNEPAKPDGFSLGRL